MFLADRSSQMPPKMFFILQTFICTLDENQKDGKTFFQRKYQHISISDSVQLSHYNISMFSPLLSYPLLQICFSSFFLSLWQFLSYNCVCLSPLIWNFRVEREICRKRKKLHKRCHWTLGKRRSNSLGHLRHLFL